MAIANSVFRLKLSVSSEGFPCKPTKAQIPTLRFTRRNLTVDEFCNLISKGHCFCHWFNSSKQEFGLSEKKDCNFDTANVVFIDVDKSELEMNQLVSQLSQKPTVYYTTPSNLTAAKERKYCFRLCYAFFEDISGAEFKALYNAIVKSIKKDVPSYNNEDNCGGKVSQYMNGNGSQNCEIHSTDRIYAQSDFDWQSYVPEENGKSKSANVSESSPSAVKLDEYFSNKEMIADLAKISNKELSYNSFLLKYSSDYEYFDRTIIDFEGEKYKKLNGDYFQIVRKYRWENIDGKNRCRIIKIKDGEGRRAKLYVTCLIRRKIKPTITYDELLYCLVNDARLYFDNEDGVLNNYVLKRTVVKSMSIPADEIRLESNDKRSFAVNREYASLLNLTVRGLVNQVRAELHHADILSKYDKQLSVGKNYKSMKSKGIRVSRQTLYTICKENGIDVKGVTQT